MSCEPAEAGGILGAYIEIQYDSREIHSTVNSTEQTFVFSLFIDEDEQTPSAPHSSIFGLNDDVAFLEYVYGILPDGRFLPNSSGAEVLLVLSDVRINQVGPKEWRCVAQYKFDSNTGQGGSRPENPQQGVDFALEYVKMHFTIGGDVTNITKSNSSDPVLASDSNLPGVPSNALAIGASENGVEGYNAPAGFRLQITGYYFPWAVDLNFADTLSQLIWGPKHEGTYNDDVFLGRPAGTLSLLSATGGGSVVDIIPITYEFDFKPNITAQ